MIDNPVRGRFNAWFLAALDGYMHWKYAAIKSRLLGQAPAVVVELAPRPGRQPSLRAAWHRAHRCRAESAYASCA